ncbi:UNVERIFIED_ORG: hypothetical protein B2H93_14800 [Clostridium botulinum]
MSKKKEENSNDLKSILDNKKIWYFIKWYMNGHKEEDYKTVQTILGINKDSNWAIKNYLEREDVRRCMIEITKLNKDFNLVQIYNKMYEKALEGDVNSANWIVKFSESDFFKNKVNEFKEMVKGLDVSE